MTHVASSKKNTLCFNFLYFFDKIKSNRNKNNNSKLTDTECSGSVSKMMQ